MTHALKQESEMGCDIKPVERCDTAAEGAALGLLGLMSGISEEYWYASWLRGLEFDLWNVAANTKYGHGTITERQAALLRLLSDECDGWWHWTNSEADSPEFVSLDEWRAILKQGPESYRPSIP